MVDEASKPVSDLSDESVIKNGDKGTYQAVYTNTADYGRETIFVGDKLYLRPRYQRWHGRAPESAGEPVEIRESFYGAIAATWDLVGYAAELTDRGVVQVAGKSGRKIEIKLDPSASKAPREALAQRKWREGRSIEALAGKLQAAVSELGKPAAIAAPPDGEVVATPGRLREVDERDYLLQGIAPPIRKNPDGTAVQPAPAPAAGSAAPKANKP